MNGWERVWNAILGNDIDRIPKGEMFISDELIPKFNIPDLESLLILLKSDLVTFEINSVEIIKTCQFWCKKCFFVFGLFQGPFTLLCSKLGWKNMCNIIIKQPSKAKNIMRSLMWENKKLIDYALNIGFDGILFADDLAGSNRLIVSPFFLKENYFPIVSEFIHNFDINKVPFIFHSDGQVKSIIPMIKESGFWGIQGLQPSVGISSSDFDLNEYFDWVFWGNFEFEGSKDLKSTDEVKNEVINLLHNWSCYPRYIFGTSGGLHKNLSPEIIRVAYDIVDNFICRS